MKIQLLNNGSEKIFHTYKPRCSWQALPYNDRVSIAVRDHNSLFLDLWATSRTKIWPNCTPDGEPFNILKLQRSVIKLNSLKYGLLYNKKYVAHNEHENTMRIMFQQGKIGKEDYFIVKIQLVINYMIIILLLLLPLLADSCQPNEYYNVTLQQCAMCDASCSTCSSLVACSDCNPGYYLQGSTCPSCPVACTTCSNLITCTSCANGFYLNSNSSTCQLCSSNCLSCSINICKKCNPGLYPSGNSCFACQPSCDCSDGGSPSCRAIADNLLVAIIIAPILLIITIVFVCFLVKRCKKKQQKPIQSATTQTDSESFNSLGYGLKLIGVMLNMKKNNWIFNKNDQQIDRNQICSICLHNAVNLVTKCNHFFHLGCLCRWLKENQTCPMCKSLCNKQMRKYCKQCNKNYIVCDLKTAFKYNVSFFDVCFQCQSSTQTQISLN